MVMVQTLENNDRSGRLVLFGDALLFESGIEFFNLFFLLLLNLLNVT